MRLESRPVRSPFAEAEGVAIRVVVVGAWDQALNVIDEQGHPCEPHHVIVDLHVGRPALTACAAVQHAAEVLE